MYIIGKTGMGKSVLIENMVYSDIVNGNGLALMDPHGDSVELILRSIPSNRINDVVYINPADLDYPVSFNVLEKVEPKYRHLVASGIIGVFKKLWADSWGPRLEYLLRNSILALLDYPDSTLLGVNRMLVDKDYRKKVVDMVKDPVVRAFWVDEYAKYDQKFMVEAIAPIQNKVGQFLSTALIRNVVGQVRSTIDMRKIMDEGKILLVNLSKGRIGEDASAMLGAMIITKIQLAAMSRVDIPEKTRNDFYLYVDEFQNFATDAFANILSEARKYRLNLIVGHQYIEQLDEKVSAAIFGNVGTFVVFRVGAADAEVLVKEFEPIFMEEDLVNIPKWHVYLKLMIDGVASDPFSAATLPPEAVDSGNEEKVILASRERYGRPRHIVEEKVARWAGMVTDQALQKQQDDWLRARYAQIVAKDVDFLASINGVWHAEEAENEAPPVLADATTTTEPAAADKRPPRILDENGEPMLFDAKCDACGAKTQITFQPDGERPVYCKECLKEFRRSQSKAQDREKYQAELAARGEKPKIHPSLIVGAAAPGATTNNPAPVAPPSVTPRPVIAARPIPTTPPARPIPTTPAAKPIPTTPPASYKPALRANQRPNFIKPITGTTPLPVKAVKSAPPVTAEPVKEISLTEALTKGFQAFGNKTETKKVDDDILKNYQAIINGEEEIIDEDNV